MEERVYRLPESMCDSPPSPLVKDPNLPRPLQMRSTLFSDEQKNKIRCSKIDLQKKYIQNNR